MFCIGADGSGGSRGAAGVHVAGERRVQVGAALVVGGRAARGAERRGARRARALQRRRPRAAAGAGLRRVRARRARPAAGESLLR